MLASTTVEPLGPSASTGTTNKTAISGTMMNAIDEDESFHLVDIEDTVADSVSLSEDESNTVIQEEEEENVPVVLQAHPEALRSSIRHVDSLNNFVRHCEVNARHGEEPAPSLQEQQKHKVRFPQLDRDLVVVHLIPDVRECDKGMVWLTAEDFECQERDIKMTCFRWEVHQSGELTFDENRCSIRGLEHLYVKKTGPSVKRRHRIAVLAEVKRQQKRQQGKGGFLGGTGTSTLVVLDHQSLQKVSQSLSVDDVQNAVLRGQADEEAHRRAWAPANRQASGQHNSCHSNKNKGGKTKKKGKGLFGLFRKK